MFKGLHSFLTRLNPLINEPQGPVKLGWTIEGPKSLCGALRKLHQLVPSGSILYLDMVSEPEVQEYAATRQVPGALDFPRGWSNRPATFPHLPVQEDVLCGLADVCEKFHPAEVTSTIIVYQGKDVLLTWHDAPDDPIYVSAIIEEEPIRTFCAQVGCRYSKENRTASDLNSTPELG